MLNKINLLLEMFSCKEGFTVYAYNKYFIQKDRNTRHTSVGNIRTSIPTVIEVNNIWDKVYVR